MPACQRLAPNRPRHRTTAKTQSYATHTHRAACSKTVLLPACRFNVHQTKGLGGSRMSASPVAHQWLAASPSAQLHVAPLPHSDRAPSRPHSPPLLPPPPAAQPRALLPFLCSLRSPLALKPQPLGRPLHCSGPPFLRLCGRPPVHQAPVPSASPGGRPPGAPRASPWRPAAPPPCPPGPRAPPAAPLLHCGQRRPPRVLRLRPLLLLGLPHPVLLQTPGVYETHRGAHRERSGFANAGVSANRGGV